MYPATASRSHEADVVVEPTRSDVATTTFKLSLRGKARARVKGLRDAAGRERSFRVVQ